MIPLPVSFKAVCLLCLLTATSVTAQNKPAQNTWTFGMGTGASIGIKPAEKSLFRGNSMASKMFGRYNLGVVGLGFNTGIVPGSISSTAINQFLTDRKFPADVLQTISKPMNAYLLFGPAFSFGKQVKITADINGGVFYNNAGGLSISQQGAAKPLYRFDAGSKNIMPGFSGALNIAYPLNHSTRFFINTDYLQSTSSIRLLDPQRGIDIATEQNRNVQLFTAGLGIIKSFSAAREQATGIATGKKHIANVKYQDMARETGSGAATGRRILTPRDPASGLATGKRNAVPDNNQSCGPVTLKTTNADGSSEEQTFSCPADALNYKRQTQGTSFGEKVNAGLHAAGGALAQGRYPEPKKIVHRDIAARNILVGHISWSGAGASGIVTNQMAKVSSVSTMAGGSGSGAAAASYARNGVASMSPSGISTAIHAREAASGMATGRRQYQPVFFEGENNNCTDCMASVVSNPLYTDKGMEGNNPLYENNKRSIADNDCAGMAGLKVYLIDAESGAAVAVTQTEACGYFWFANIPSGNYVVKISGNIRAKKGYDMYLKNKGSYDVAGEMLLADDFWSVELQSAEGTPEEAAALVKTKAKSNQSNDRMADNNSTGPAKASINTTRSNIKHLRAMLADSDGDGVSEIWVGERTALLGGALPGGAVISAAMRPGGPIGGIIVKGGKNPGGQMRTTTTNEFGEFEFANWEEGNYSISTELNYMISDETFVVVGDDEMNDRISMNVTVPKQTQGASFGEKVSSGINNINNNMPNRISMNVTVAKQTQGATFGEKVNAGKADLPNTKARNNNTVRSNRTDNALVIADLDGDGSMESSYLNFNGEIAVITVAPPANGKVVEKATSGLKDVVKTQVRMAAQPFPIKWSAPEVLRTQVWGDPHVDQKDGTLILGAGNDQTVPKEKWQSSALAVKAIRCSDGTCAIISGKADELPADARIAVNNLPGEPVANAAVWFTDNKGNVYSTTTDQNGTMNLNGLPPGIPFSMLMNIGANGSDDIIISFSTDAQGNAISNVLKTKHDTVKNSIGNIR